MGMYLLKPACKDYLWGGHKLVDEYNVEYDGDVCAEAWVMSCHKDGNSIITNGIERGQTLSAVVARKGREILGKNCEKYKDFPILIKFIDAKKPLSIQVHPDDEYALSHENQYGKTEMWYVLEAEEGAYLYHGFEKEISKEEFERRIKENTLTEVLHKEYVKRGDVIFITPGTLHSIGAGLLIAEIQQSSNVTYRIYDFGRVGADGKPRQLHIQQSLDVTKIEKPMKYKSTDEHMVNCDFFCVDRIKANEKPYEDIVDDSSFVSLLVIDGEGKISAEGENLEVKKGDSVFITAGAGKYSIEGNVEVIKTIVP
ncbi:type I phosphomannose isomerase catalytic subunit [Butyrivibrio sp. INlla14]|uniref:type I phosphomannose isomerase catalytic subunit n=1 Tax=Butyrivibrio sp. INlla14 TaxID=1520808 RepID=UPI0008769E59|nr:type I phosphomannose isomerase catalytic subunit [Butyrivibrio sp. INlla14]SCX98122.1 mannose-6-phosphate isomerase [Butyrivibrio sp. INlla14]